MMRSVITGTGSFIPEYIQANENFLLNDFYEEKGKKVAGSAQMIIEKFRKITGIGERRYVADGQTASDIAAIAGMEALTDSGTDPETLDQLIVSHNFGDVTHKSKQSQNVPALANRVKNLLGIKRPECIGYDILFGCPGWVQSLIQTDAYFKAGMAKKALLIGTETLSRVLDPADRDSMIFADGAGACVLEYKETATDSGILGSCARTHSFEEAYYIDMGKSYSASDDETLYIKMKGRKVYEYALKQVPLAMKQCLDECNIGIRAVNKIFIHQANEKMDEEILKRLYELYGEEAPHGVMPMSIHWLGNSSVATVPTLYDMVRKNKTPGQQVHEGDIVLFASVGAGMNINAVCYRV